MFVELVDFFFRKILCLDYGKLVVSIIFEPHEVVCQFLSEFSTEISVLFLRTEFFFRLNANHRIKAADDALTE